MLELVRGHAAELLRFARRFSLCPDDAHDAYQRALEILVRRLRESSVDNPLSYLRTIIRHEAYQVRVERERDVPRHEVDAEAAGTEPGDSPLERVERFERLAHTAEALQRLKPQELKALTLRAQGLSYREICDREGWTYTRCNRAISEGRRALLDRLTAIESGAECERWLPLLSAFADGEADARSLVELRPHLRTCTGCRATLRELHDAARGLRSIVPPELLLPAVAASGSGSGLTGHAEALLQTALDRVASPAHGALEPAAVPHGALERAMGTAHGALERVAGAAHAAVERITAPALRLQGAVEALPAGKVAAVAASTVAVAGGGAAIERATTDQAASHPPARVEQAAAPAGGTAQPVRSPPLTTANASTPTVRVPASSLPAGPEWPLGGAGSHAQSFLLDEFGFEGPFPRSSGAPPAGTGANGTAAGAGASASGGTAAAAGSARGGADETAGGRAGRDAAGSADGRADGSGGGSGGGAGGDATGSAGGRAGGGAGGSAGGAGAGAGEPTGSRGSDASGRGAAEAGESGPAAASQPSSSTQSPGGSAPSVPRSDPEFPASEF